MEILIPGKTALILRRILWIFGEKLMVLKRDRAVFVWAPSCIASCRYDCTFAICVPYYLLYPCFVFNKMPCCELRCFQQICVSHLFYIYRTHHTNGCQYSKWNTSCHFEWYLIHHLKLFVNWAANIELWSHRYAQYFGTFCVVVMNWVIIEFINPLTHIRKAGRLKINNLMKTPVSLT